MRRATFLVTMFFRSSFAPVPTLSPLGEGNLIRASRSRVSEKFSASSPITRLSRGEYGESDKTTDGSTSRSLKFISAVLVVDSLVRLSSAILRGVMKLSRRRNAKTSVKVIRRKAMRIIHLRLKLEMEIKK